MTQFLMISTYFNDRISGACMQHAQRIESDETNIVQVKQKEK